MYIYLLIGKFNIPPWPTPCALEQLLLLKTDLAETCKEKQKEKKTEKPQKIKLHRVMRGILDAKQTAPSMIRPFENRNKRHVMLIEDGTLVHRSSKTFP